MPFEKSGREFVDGEILSSFYGYMVGRAKYFCMLNAILCLCGIWGCAGRGEWQNEEKGAETVILSGYPYDWGMPNAKYADSVFLHIERVFVDGDECPIGELIKACRIESYIYSLNEKTGFFEDDSVSPFITAMGMVEHFVAPGEYGSQAMINRYYNILRVLEYVRMLKVNHDLLQLGDSGLFVKEYLLWYEYKEKKDDWNAVCRDTLSHFYSSLPMDVAEGHIKDYCERRLQLENLMDFWLHETKFEEGDIKSVSEDDIRRYFHAMMPGIFIPAREEGSPEANYPTDTLGQCFLDWMEYREKLADELPYKQKEFYKRQTNEIKQELLEHQ